MKRNTHSNTHKVYDAKQKWVDEFVEMSTFSIRCSQLCSWVEIVYGAPKVLLFFHSERRSRYIVHRLTGIYKSHLALFDFYHEPFIYDDARSHENGRYNRSMPLDEWKWFKAKLKHNLKKAGLNRILPLWSGRECLGGLIFKMPRVLGAKDVKSAATFESAAADFAHLLEIALAQRLLIREAWEKKVLLEVGKKISELDELDSVLNLIIDSIREVIPYDAAGIFLIKMPGKKLEYAAIRGYPENIKDTVQIKVGKGITGWSIEHAEEVNVPDVRKDKRYVMARKSTRSQLSVPIIYGNTVMGAFSLESNKVHFFKYHDVELMRTFAAQTAIVLENSKLLYQVFQANQMLQELEIAKDIQKALLPKKLPEIHGYDFAAINHSSLAIGGDMYDFVTLTEDELGVAVGDVAGKGVPAALLMATLYATFRGFTRQHVLPNLVMHELNASLYAQTAIDKFATFFYGILDSKAGSFRYSNAGHNPPIVYRADDKWQELKKGGPLLGFVPDRAYLSDTITLQSGDVLCLYTDGVSEAQNVHNQEFDVRGITKSLKKFRELSAAEIIKKMLSEIKKFTQKSHQDDDLTMIVIKKL